MAESTIKHPLNDYKIAKIGPDREWDFAGKDGQVYMRTFSVQMEGIADWADLNQAAKADAPKEGDVLRGHIEDAGKYGLKFVKEKKSGNWSGGGKSSPGAAWSAAYNTAAAVVAGYFAASDSKPGTIQEYLSKVDQVAATVKASIDKQSGTVEAPKPAAAQEALPVVDTDNNPVVPVSEGELGSW